MMIDYHVHTPLCNHAEGTMESYVQKAVEIGLKDICFLDHLTFPERENGQSMRAGEVALYFQAVQILKHRYKGSVNVKAGLEVDFNPAHIDDIQNIVQTFAFDVIGGSLHSPCGEDIVSHSSDWGHGKLDADDIYDLYFKELDKMLDCSYFDMLCHLDLFKKFGRKPSRSFDDQLDRLLRKIKKKNLTIEVNTSGYDHIAQEMYPSPGMIIKCQRLDIPLTLGSDAHTPENIGQHYERILPVLVSAGHRRLSTFTKRKRNEIAISL